jgi:hypothetical protein
MAHPFHHSTPNFGRVGSRMKTTIELPDPRFAKANATAQRELATVRQLVKRGMQRVIRERSAKKKPFELRNGSVRGGALTAQAIARGGRRARVKWPMIEIFEDSL